MHNLDVSYMSPSEETTMNEFRQRRRRSTSAERSFSSENGERVSVLISAGDGKSKVRFYRFSSVILIPSRTEYRMAECDLWWQREDFVGFQQTACSELRMLCNIDSIGVREARRRLYQPEFAKDAERRRLHDLGGEYGDDSQSRRNSMFMDTDNNTSDEYEGFVSTASSSPSSTENDEMSPILNLTTSPSKLSLQVFQSAGDLVRLAANHQSDVEMDTDDLSPSFSDSHAMAETEGTSMTPGGSPVRRLRHWSLHLCVPLKPFTVPLVLEPSHTSHHGRRRGSRNGARDNSGFLAVMGFCSFALPIVGFLIFNSGKFSLFQTLS